MQNAEAFFPDYLNNFSRSSSFNTERTVLPSGVYIGVAICKKAVYQIVHFFIGKNLSRNNCRKR